MTSFRMRPGVVTTSVVALVLAGGAPAQAVDEPELPVWNMAPCVTVLELRPAPPDHLYNSLEGWVERCDPVVEGGGFRIATYRTDTTTGEAPGYNVRLFDRGAEQQAAVKPAPKDDEGEGEGEAAASEPAAAISHFGVAAVPTQAGEYGVCVLAGDEVRVACFRVEVTPGEQGWLDVLSPLDVDDPLVDKDVVTTPYIGEHAPRTYTRDVGSSPACGTCF